MTLATVRSEVSFFRKSLRTATLQLVVVIAQFYRAKPQFGQQNWVKLLNLYCPSYRYVNLVRTFCFNALTLQRFNASTL